MPKPVRRGSPRVNASAKTNNRTRGQPSSHWQPTNNISLRYPIIGCVCSGLQQPDSNFGGSFGAEQCAVLRSSQTSVGLEPPDGRLYWKVDLRSALSVEEDGQPSSYRFKLTLYQGTLCTPNF
eukprot:scaffold215086_cov25-Prasinocladus_malaysianus.AAC.6